MSSERIVRIYLIINWKTGNARALKTAPKDWQMKGTEIPLTLDLTFRIPEPQELKLKAEVVFGEAEVSKIAIDALDEATR